MLQGGIHSSGSTLKYHGYKEVVVPSPKGLQGPLLHKHYQATLLLGAELADSESEAAFHVSS